jgi:hypothetical protein
MGFFKEKTSRLLNRTKISTKSKMKEDTKELRGTLTIKVYDMFDGGKLIHTYHQSNIIVNTASILIARLLKNNQEPQNGISFLAIGSGSGSWNLFDPPAPTTSQINLENEFYRKAIDTSTFVHPVTGEPTSAYTNIVDYAVTLGEGEAVGPIVELSLFGGDATSELNSGTMLNWRTFPVINKTSTMSVSIIFRITS